MGLRSELLWFSMKLLDLGWITSSLLGSVFVFVQWDITDFTKQVSEIQ